LSAVRSINNICLVNNASTVRCHVLITVSLFPI